MTDPAYLGDTFDGDAPGLAELMEMAARQSIANFYASIPARVVSYDAATQLAVVQPVVQVVGGDGVPRLLPPIAACRVLFLSAGDWHLTFDVAAGDTGLVLVSSVCISQWLEGADEAAAPESTRRGNLADGTFLPAKMAKPAALTAPAGMSIGKPAARIHIAVDGGVTIESANIKLGSASAASAVALEPPLSSFFSTLKVWLDTHVHTSAAPGSPTTPAIAPSPSASGLAAAKVKAE